MENMKKKNKLIKILVPVLIVVVIAAIWIIKNSTENSSGDAVDSHPDFTLETLVLDMEQLKSHGLPIMIDFGADSCIPCKEMAPVLKSLNAEYQGMVIRQSFCSITRCSHITARSTQAATTLRIAVASTA